MGPLIPGLPAGPPAEIKVFAFDGTTVEAKCWIGVRPAAKHPQRVELFLLHESGRLEVLSKKVVVQNLETGEVIYNPRKMGPEVIGYAFLTASETRWLKKNPHWPNILELYDNPVGKEEEENNGLYA